MRQGYTDINIVLDRWRVLVTFENGEEWRTASHFETTVIRGEK